MKNEHKTKEQLINDLVEMRQRIAGLEAADAERKRAEEEIRQRTTQLEALRQVGLEITTQLDLDALLNSIVSRAIGLLVGASGGLYLYRPEEDVLEWAIAVGPHLSPIGAVLHRGEGLSGRVWETGKPLIVDDYQAWEGQAAVYEDYPFKAVVGVPVRWGEEFLGVLNVLAEPQHTFSPADAELLGLFATQAAVAIQNARLFEREREQRDLAEALEEAAAALTATLDFDQVLDRILEQVSRVVPNDATNIMLIEGDQARIVRWRSYERFGAEELISTIVFRIPEVPDLQQMMESGEPMVIPNTATYPGWVHLPVTEWLRSHAAAPIIVRGEVIGFLNVDSATPGFFTQAHAEALRAFADHAAAAIENARLYEASRRRSEGLAVLHATSLDITAPHDLPTLLQTIVERAARLLDAPGGGMYLCDPDRREVRCVVSYNTPRDYTGTVLKYGEGLAGTMAETGEPLIIDDYRTWPGRAAVYEEEQPFTAILSAPMIWQGQVTGVIHVLENVEIRRFTQANLELLSLFANQAAIAIENARLYEETKRRAEEMTALHETALDITAQLEMQHLLNAIITRASDLLGATGGLVHLYDPARERLVAVTSHNLERDYTGLTLEVGEGVAGKVFQTGQPLIIDDHLTWAGKSLQVDDAFARSMLGVPLRWQEQVIGVLDIMDNVRVGAFDERDLGLLTLFANQAAIAIENTRLYEETRQRVLQLQTVEEVGRRVSSILDLDELFPYVTKAVQQNFGYYHVDIFLVKPATGCAVFKASSDPAAEKVWKEHDLHFKIGEEGMIGWVAHTGDPLLVNDVSQESLYLPDESLPETRSELVVPLKVEGRVVGVLDVNSNKLNAFDKDDLFVLQTLANQVAIAIENARLFEETEHLKTFNENVVQGIAEAILIEDAQGVFTFANPAAEELLGYTREELIGRHWTTIVPEDEIEKVGQELAKRPHGIVSRYEMALLNKEGQVIPVIVSGRPLLEEGKFVGVLFAFTDIRERVRAEREIEERRVYLEGVLSAAPDAIVTLDARHRIVEWNTGAEKLFGYSPEEAVGQDLDRLITRPDVFEEAVEFTQVVMAVMEVPPIETVRYRKDGSPVDVIVAGSPILVGDEFIGVVAVYTDITARKRMEDTLRALALLDDLTGLYNRRGFLTLGQQQLKTANRAKRRMMLLFADFDGLKRINDTFGHPEGDRALIETADILRETFRESDIIARIGGDEFVVLAIETNGAPTEILAIRLQEKLEARNAREGRRYELSLSVGLTSYDPEHPCFIDELVARADRAMYEQKRGDQK